MSSSTALAISLLGRSFRRAQAARVSALLAGTFGDFVPAQVSVSSSPTFSSVPLQLTDAVPSDLGAAAGQLARVHPLPNVLTGLVPSAEPSVVFAGLAARCVPELCSGCRIDVIDVVDGVSGRYSIANPPRPASSGGLERLLEQAAARPEHVVQVPFQAPPPDGDAADDDDDAADDEPGSGDAFHGVATFVWDRRTVTHADRALVTLMIDHAVRTVSWQRAEDAARDASAAVDNLQIALRTSRRIGTAIGILMSSQKVTEQQAFGLLVRASQRGNRKVRDVALDVIDLGCVDMDITGNRVPVDTVGRRGSR